MSPLNWHYTFRFSNRYHTVITGVVLVIPKKGKFLPWYMYYYHPSLDSSYLCFCLCSVSMFAVLKYRIYWNTKQLWSNYRAMTLVCYGSLLVMPEWLVYNLNLVFHSCIVTLTSFSPQLVPLTKNYFNLVFHSCIVTLNSFSPQLVPLTKNYFVQWFIIPLSPVSVIISACIIPPRMWRVPHH